MKLSKTTPIIVELTAEQVATLLHHLEHGDAIHPRDQMTIAMALHRGVRVALGEEKAT